MKKKILFSVVTCVLISNAICAQREISKKSNPVSDTSFFNGVKKWFDAWELVCKEVYNVHTLKPVSFVFFDDKYVYSTSPVTIPQGVVVKGPGLFNTFFTWKKTVIKDSIVLPDKSKVPVGLMSFASGQTGKRPFFVMPLLAFWEKSGVVSRELGLENLVTGVFIHEFSHSQQMQNFGKKVTGFEKQNDFGIEFSDDIVQNIFSKDSLYVKAYLAEVNTFYEALAETDRTRRDSLLNAGMHLFHERHRVFFTGRYEPLDQIDDFFLTMEGLGQFSIYCWLTNAKGPGFPEATAINGVRRNKKWWSQDEGLVLFLLLNQFSSPGTWGKKMFGNETDSIIRLLEKELSDH